MVKVGLCDVTVGPHYFDAMLYTVKDPNAQPQPLQYAPPRPMMHYNGPNNFQRYPPYPSPNQQRPPYSPAPSGRPPQGYQTPQQRAPNASSPSGQRPPQTGQTGQPAKPSPDPVIQMLATRAAADPELKALMRVVASSQASQEQLRAFQAHIDELNAIIKAREQQQNTAGKSTQQTPSQPGTPAMQDKPTTSQNESQQKQEPGAKTAQEPGSKLQPAAPAETPSKEIERPTSSDPKASPAKLPSEGTPSGSQAPTLAAEAQPAAAPQDAAAPVKQEPGTNNTQATPTAAQHPASTPTAVPAPAGSPAPNAASQPGSAARPAQTPGNFQQPPRPGQPYTPQPSLQSRPPQYGSPTPYYRPPGPQQPQSRVGYKSVVFEFTSPLTPYGNVNSGHAGSGDRYLFPEHSILEWIPSENVILASFIIVRKVDPSKPFPIEPEGEPTTSRSKSKASKSKKGKGKDTIESATPNPGNPTDTPQKTEPTDKTGINPSLSVPATPGTPAEPVVKEENLKEYWQPVTFRIHASNPRILEPLTRVVKPAEEVRKYMNEIIDRAERAPDGFPAFRLPREDARDVFESEGTPASGANLARSRPSRATIKAPEEESEVENSLDVEEEEDLLDFYGAPMGLPSLKALKA